MGKVARPEAGRPIVNIAPGPAWTTASRGDAGSGASSHTASDWATMVPSAGGAAGWSGAEVTSSPGAGSVRRSMTAPGSATGAAFQCRVMPPNATGASDTTPIDVGVAVTTRAASRIGTVPPSTVQTEIRLAVVVSPTGIPRIGANPWL